MANLTCKIMRGCSGSGKSTYTRKHFPGAFVCSTDDFWLNPATGKYEFDPKRAGEAHAWNLRRFIDFIQHWGDYTGDENVTVVVDNTNTTVAEFAPYVAVANAYGFDTEIISLDVDVDVAHARNVHGVPQPTVHGQRRNFVANMGNIPKWWKHKIVKEG